MTPEHIILIYGAGGLGKSTTIAQAAAHLWKKSGLRTRVVGADGGGIKPFKPLIDKGIVDYWPIDLWDEKSVFATMDLATKGWFPLDSNKPGSELLPPAEEYRECPVCNQDCGARGLSMVTKCIACTVAITPGVRLEKKMRPVNNSDKVGLYAFEGATAFGQRLLSRLKSIDSSGGMSIKDGETTITQLGMQHYGIAQSYLGQYVANARLIPTFMVMWTALELRGNDDGYGKPIYGPALPGKKLTAMCIPWFTDVIHIEGQEKAKTQMGSATVERQFFLTTHYPPDTKPFGFIAKNSAPLGGDMPEVLIPKPGENVITTYFTELEAANTKAVDKLLA